MIDSQKLLPELQKQVRQLEEDLRARCDTNADVDRPLRVEYEAAKKKGRTALTYSAWRDEELTQVAVAWVLASVFVRFLEDNELIETPYLAGPGSRLRRAKDEHEMFFRKHPTVTEREYFEKVFTEVGILPPMKELFDRKRNPLWHVTPSGDAARELLDFWRRTDPESGALVHDFTDSRWNTRFLGDLYQDLSEAAQKKFALLQTPEFIEEFILDRALSPAIQTFGYQVVRMIDPTCGSGHFLLGGFYRLFRLWQEHHPEQNPRVLAQKALDGICGVDLNPYAVAIARFRLLLAALKTCEVKRLRDAPDFRIQLAVGDSLAHGRRFREFESHIGPQRTFDTEEVFRDELKHHYEVEDVEALHQILGQQYHAVVGNPPYITVKDRAVSKLYRTRYLSCHRSYSLSVPFMERFFDLAVNGNGTPHQPGGFVGQITANSFMKREFGKKLIEDFFPRWDLTHVIDTAGVYIPGHGTPTVILLGKNQPPVSGTIRSALGIRSEPVTPAEPEQGLVWQAICRQIDQPGSESEWISAADSPRAKFHQHPWSIGGGGAADLKTLIDEAASTRLGEVAVEIGYVAVTREDEAFVMSSSMLARHGVEGRFVRPFVEGEQLRDWRIVAPRSAAWPYDGKTLAATQSEKLERFLWPNKPSLSSRVAYGMSQLERGLEWFEYSMFFRNRFRIPLSIGFAFVATHNHFVLNHDRVVFGQSAPVIKLKSDATEADHLKLLGVLNSSTVCFWLQQVCHNKGRPGAEAAGADERYEQRYEFDNTKVGQLPLVRNGPLVFAKALDTLAQELQRNVPAAVLSKAVNHSRMALNTARAHWQATLHLVIALQEELDWHCYRSYGIIEGNDLLAPTGSDGLPVMDGPRAALPPVRFGERAFEILLARRMARQEEQSTWFERHGANPTTEPPANGS
jgi:hypothetical protein